MTLAQNPDMHEPAGVFTDHPELEVDDSDIVCFEPAEDGRSATRLRYRRMNAFLGDYFGRLRRGDTMLMNAPTGAREGDVIDIEIAIDGQGSFVLHGQITALWAGQALVRFIIGKLTDRIVAPIIEGALGAHHASGLFGDRGP